MAGTLIRPFGHLLPGEGDDSTLLQAPIARTIALAISIVPTADGSSRLGFMS